MAKKIEQICKNCKLYNPEEGICRVNVIMEGEYYELPVKPNDKCHWQGLEKELSEKFGERFELPIQQVRIWSDGQKGYVEETIN